MYHVYVLKSLKTGELYKGFTTDLRRRYAEHNNARVKSTKVKIPWQLIYYEAFSNETDARREEIFLKTGKGRERLKYLLSK